MATRERPTFGNHAVANQPPPLAGYNVFQADPAGRGGSREGADWAKERIAAAGEFAGTAEAGAGRARHENAPKPKTHAVGNRVDEPEFHPAWHDLLGIGLELELHSLPLEATRDRAPTSPAAPPSMCFSQAEAGIGCPVSMTYSVIPALRDASRSWRRSGSRTSSPPPITRGTHRLQRRWAPWPAWG